MDNAILAKSSNFFFSNEQGGNVIIAAHSGPEYRWCYLIIGVIVIIVETLG